MILAWQQRTGSYDFVQIQTWVFNRVFVDLLARRFAR